MFYVNYTLTSIYRNDIYSTVLNHMDLGGQLKSAFLKITQPLIIPFNNLILWL